MASNRYWVDKRQVRVAEKAWYSGLAPLPWPTKRSSIGAYQSNGVKTRPTAAKRIMARAVFLKRHGRLERNVKGTHMGGAPCGSYGHRRRARASCCDCLADVPARTCFPDLESSNFNWLHLISFRLARTHAYARLRHLFLDGRASFPARRHGIDPGSLDDGDAPVRRHQEPEDRLGFNIVPMWHPLRLSEDYPMADILTGERVIFGVGRDYHTRD